MKYKSLAPGCLALLLFVGPQAAPISVREQSPQQGSQGSQQSSQGSQQEQSPPPKDAVKPTRTDQISRLTIEVSGGDENTPVENASVYIKYVEEHAVKKNKTVELNVKTNREGIAHVGEAPMGRALVQIVADGWKTYGRWHDLNEAKQTIKVHLERPPKWY